MRGSTGLIPICIAGRNQQYRLTESMIEKMFDPAEYVEQMARLMDLPLQPEHRAGVVDNFARIQAVAKLVTEFPLPEEIEAAPVFEP